MLKRVFLFLVANLAVMVVISVVLSVLGVRPYLTKTGLDYQSLLAFAAVVGFAGSFVSLFLSKWMTKRAYGVEVIQEPQTPAERWLVATVAQISAKAGIKTPEVGIYESPEPNAFATGWNKNGALVAVSTGLLESMDADELEGVLAHEVAHAANGDMVTLALVQGVVNTFVIFFARVAAYFVTSFFSKGDEEEGAGVGGIVYFLVSMVFEILFGILASVVVMYVSRLREFRADGGSADLVGRQKMIKALQRLNTLQGAPVDPRAPEMATMKINNQGTWMKFFRSHPPLEERIAALQSRPPVRAA